MGLVAATSNNSNFFELTLFVAYEFLLRGAFSIFGLLYGMTNVSRRLWKASHHCLQNRWDKECDLNNLPMIMNPLLVLDGFK